MNSRPDSIRAIAKPVVMVLAFVSIILCLTFMNRCSRLIQLAPHRAFIAAAREEFIKHRGEPRFDDPTFLSFGIGPDWKYDRVVSEFQRRGFVPSKMMPVKGQGMTLIYVGSKRYGHPAIADPVLDMNFGEEGVLWERVLITFDANELPLVMLYDYKEVQVMGTTNEHRAYDFRTQEITADMMKFSDFASRGLVPATR